MKARPKSIHDTVFRGTRGRLLPLLRGPGRTVLELAGELDMTGNAVRAHLAALERDGLVETRPARRGAGKPSQVFALTPLGEALFPKAHGLVLGVLLEELRSRLKPEELRRFLHGAAARIPLPAVPPGSPRSARLEAAAAVFDALGGVGEVESGPGGEAIICRQCPLGDVTAGHDEPCRLAEDLLRGIAGEPLESRCQRGPRPSCRFEVRAPGAADERSS